MKVQKKSRTKAKTDSTGISYPNKNKSVVCIYALGIALATFLVYLPALNNDFVNWDDDILVYKNYYLKPISLQFLWWAITDTSLVLWNPMLWLSFSLDYTVWGLNPKGYHLTNIVLHAVNTFLVFILAVRLLEHSNYNKDKLNKKAIITGTVTALLFGLHPLRVESVVWVTERKDVLYSLFFLSSILAYLRYASADLKKFNYYALCLILFILSLMSKPMAVTLPAVLLILDFYPLRRLTARNIKPALLEKLPFILLSMVLSVITLWGHHLAGAVQTLEQTPLLYRILIAAHAYTFYIVKMILPLNLSPFYPLPLKSNLFSVESLGAVIFLLTTTFLCIWYSKKNKLLLAMWIYYIVTLTPVIGIIYIGRHSVADRYTYLPSIGLFLLVGLGVAYIYERCSKRQTKIALIAILVIIFGVLAKMTVRQIAVWQDSLTLWSHAIRIFPDSDLPAYLNLCSAYLEAGDYKQALENCDKAIKIDPKDPNTYINRGLVYDSLGEYQLAIADYNKAIDLNPQDAATYSNLAITYNNLGRLDDAIKALSLALRLQPDDPIVHNNLGNAYFAKGLLDNAVREYLSVLTMSPDFVDARYNLALVYISQGRSNEAGREFETVLKLRPDYAKARQAIEQLLKK